MSQEAFHVEKSLSEQVTELIGALRQKIATLAADLAAAKKELAAARGAIVQPRKRSTNKTKVAGKGKSKPTPAAE